jgi:hypothetical protein
VPCPAWFGLGTLLAGRGALGAEIDDNHGEQNGGNAAFELHEFNHMQMNPWLRRRFTWSTQQNVVGMKKMEIKQNSPHSSDTPRMATPANKYQK